MDSAGMMYSVDLKDEFACTSYSKICKVQRYVLEHVYVVPVLRYLMISTGYVASSLISSPALVYG